MGKPDLHRGPSPDKFYKGGSQEETLLLRPEFFLLPNPHDRARSVLNCRAMDSGAGHGGPAVWIFSTSGFHRLFATKPISSETSKQYGGQVATVVLIWNDLSTTRNCFFFFFLTL